MTQIAKPAAILSIAGSDSGGGAGIQRDVATARAIGCLPTTVITAITAQNLSEVRDIQRVDLKLIESQFRAVVEGFDIRAVKIGMAGHSSAVVRIAELLREYELPNIVVDPVLVATSGGVLGDIETAEAIKEYLIPLATTIAPNQDEAEVLCGLSKGEIGCGVEGDSVWSAFRDMGAQSLLLKGGHAENWQGAEIIIDTLYTENSTTEIRGRRLNLPQHATHGTGCTLSTALACYLAVGNNIEESARCAVAFVHQQLLKG